MALWFLIHDRLTAPAQIRCGIQRYNQAHSIESTPTTGYHEAITQFRINLIQIYFDRVNIHDSLLNLANQLMNLDPNPNLLIEYYSCDLIFSPEARSFWIEPNLKSLNYARL